MNGIKRGPFPCLSLIGMPGSGKSTLAGSLSRRLGWAHVDTDHILEAWYGLSLENLMARLGKAGFLLAEERIVADLDLSRCVIATGGSVIYSARAMQRLHDLGDVVYLEADYRAISERVARCPDRGLAMDRDQDLHAIYLERTPLYESHADFTLSTEHNDPDECVSAIERWVHERKETGFS
jgi:shikimate kinase